MLRRLSLRDVVIVADADGPGRFGAKRLADRIIGVARAVKVVSPAPHKDVRAWLNAGATKEALSVRIDSANFHFVGA